MTAELLNDTIRISCRQPEDASKAYFRFKTISEFIKFCKTIGNNFNVDVNGDVIISVAANPKTYQLFNEMLAKRSSLNSTTIKWNEYFTTPVEGTSKLIRIPKRGEIMIAYRPEKSQKTSLNSICIDNVAREQFFADVKEGTIFKKKGKYILSKEDDTYEKWNKFMDEEYKQQYLRAVK